MAEELPDERFKSEVMRLLNKVIVKLGEHDQKFDGIDQRFDGVDQKFDGVDQRFDGIDRRLDGVDQRLDGIDHRLDGLEQRFDGLEQKVDRNTEEIIAVKNNVKILSARFTDVVGMVLEDNKRITKLEKDVEDLQRDVH